MAETEAAVPASVRARLAAALLAMDPTGFGGAIVRAPRADVVDRWLAQVRGALAIGAPMSRLPLGIPDDRLLGGLDLAMTLAQGRPVTERGVLARADGGVLVLPCAERASPMLVARLTEVLDTHVARPRAHQSGDPLPARVAIVAVDEGDGEDEAVSVALADRLAFHLLLEADDPFGGTEEPLVSPTEVRAAAARAPSVTLSDPRVRSLVGAAAALGVASLRAVSFAVRAARACAALDARPTANDDDCAAAAALVLGPRATRRPEPSESSASDDVPPPSSDPESGDDDSEEMLTPEELRELEERIIRAAQATLPRGLLIDAPTRAAHTGTASGRAGGDRAGGKRGRQVGTRRGDPRDGGRLDLLETLRAAAPWQRLRPAPAHDDGRVRVRVRPSDFRLRRLVEPAGTTAIFVVDASGSAAINRMSEAKGAVELLLAEAYSRRDEVALIAFRGTAAEVLLPPTRAIAAAKRALAALPGGGGTPLASAIDRARDLVAQARRAGNDTITIFLTDARANVARDGAPGRPRAESDALASAEALRAVGGVALLIDTSPRPGEQGQRLAMAMGARYVALPRCDAAGIHAAVTAAMPAGAT